MGMPDCKKIENMRIKGIFKRYAKDQDGVAAVEFALVSMGFLGLLFGTIEAGHLIWSYNAVRNATEVASRQALVQEDLTESDLEDIGKDTLDSFMVSSTNFHLTQTTETNGGVQFNKLDSTYQYTPLLSIMMPESLTNFTFNVTVSRPFNWGDE